MTVTILEPKAKELTSVELELLVEPEVVDGYGDISKEYAAAKEALSPLAAKFAEWGSGIIKAIDDVVDPSVPVVLDGESWRIKLGPKGVKLVSADSEAVIDELGMELFLKLAKVSTTDLKAYCTPEQLEKITTSTYSIKRRIKVESL